MRRRSARLAARQLWGKRLLRSFPWLRQRPLSLLLDRLVEGL